MPARAAQRDRSRAGGQRARRIRSDYAARPAPRRPGIRLATGLALAAIACSLALVAMRTDLIRVRYGLARALAEEGALREEGRELQVEVRRLRHPGRLAERARSLGFVRPERVIAWHRGNAAASLQLAAAGRDGRVDEHPERRR